MSSPSTFFQHDPTNHYCRIVHEANLDGKGYAFAYDDVQPDGGADQSGKVNAGDPKVFIVAVGGRDAYAGDRMPQAGGGSRHTSQQPHLEQDQQHERSEPSKEPKPQGARESRLSRYSAKSQKLLQKLG